MVRRYRRVAGSRKYRDFTDEMLETAVKDVKDQGLSIRQAAEKYGIPKSTVQRKLSAKNCLKPGRQCALTEDDETALTDGVLAASLWGFPFTPLDVRYIVKSYLDMQGRQEKRFKNNLPGHDWVKSFMGRNKDKLTLRLSENIKRARSEISAELLKPYYEELAITMEGVNPEAVINYDETNLTDDPGRNKVVVRRGCKHAEKIMDSSKASTSIMIAGTASGFLLPPYVVYKSEHLYDTWVQGGPKNTRYNRSKSGWFDSALFEDWFLTVVLPYFKKLDDGPKVMIGDNLASHISLRVIQECQKHGIKFVLIPANSTHLCQPLDVATFRPLKIKWRKVLLAWKEKNRGSIPKDQFPRLLKETLDSLGESTVSENLKAGFKACGIYPVDGDRVLMKLPCASKTGDTSSTWMPAFQNYLSSTRANETSSSKRLKKRRIEVIPGRSVTNPSDEPCASELHETSPCDEDESCVSAVHERPVSGPQELEQGPSTSGMQRLQTCMPQHKKRTCPKDDSSSDSDCSDEFQYSLHDSSSDVELESQLHDTLNSETLWSCQASVQGSDPKEISPGDFALVSLVYDKGSRKETQKTFMCQVIECVDGDVFTCKFMRKYRGLDHTYIFPAVDDIAEILLKNVVMTVHPISVSRGRYVFEI